MPKALANQLKPTNFFDKPYRNQLAKFLLHTENEGTLNNDEIDILNLNFPHQISWQFFDIA